MVTALVIAALLLGTIFVQDILSRSIWWFLPPLLFGAFVFYRYETLVWAELAVNVAFVVFLMGFLAFYIRLRFGKFENPFKAYFGLGDLLFLLALTPLLPFTEFVWFFTAGTFLTLVIHLLAMLIRRQQTIPYAGYFSLVTIVYLALTASGTDPFQFMKV
jgi:hypothetical protein